MPSSSKKFDRDWLFYRKNRHKFTFCGVQVDTPQYGAYTPVAKECFRSFDTSGKVPKYCREPQLFMEILRCKKSINFHLKMWAEGYNDYLMGIKEYLNELIDPPLWVEKSLRNQRRP